MFITDLYCGNWYLWTFWSWGEIKQEEDKWGIEEKKDTAFYPCVLTWSSGIVYNSSFPQTLLPGTETWESKEIDDQRRRSWSRSAFPLLLDHLFSSWKRAFLSLLFVVDVSLESFVAFCIQCQLQLRLWCGSPGFILQWLGGTVFFLGHLILLTHPVHFFLCLSPVSSSECILAGLFSCLHVF